MKRTNEHFIINGQELQDSTQRIIEKDDTVLISDIKSEKRIFRVMGYHITEDETVKSKFTIWGVTIFPQTHDYTFFLSDNIDLMLVIPSKKKTERELRYNREDEYWADSYLFDDSRGAKVCLGDPIILVLRNGKVEVPSHFEYTVRYNPSSVLMRERYVVGIDTGQSFFSMSEIDFIYKLPKV